MELSVMRTRFHIRSGKSIVDLGYGARHTHPNNYLLELRVVRQMPQDFLTSVGLRAFLEACSNKTYLSHSVISYATSALPAPVPIR
jgi:hypothetical protein